QERRLAYAVRAEHGHELARSDLQGDVGPDRAASDGRRGALQRHDNAAIVAADVAARFVDWLRHATSIRDDGRRPGRPHLPVACRKAVSNARSCADCQSWKLAPAGESVSVTVETGMPAFFAAVT
ncbi:MAG: hypothetical protein QOH29_2655, partial [Actinomycetota bacterium]|nr:hypothetical protein [Actinomycetota bacterium]